MFVFPFAWRWTDLWPNVRSLLRAELQTGPAVAVRERTPVPDKHADVVIYGETPAGIAAAAAVLHEGLTVNVIEPGKHVRRVVASGLGASDKGIEQTVAGLSRRYSAGVFALDNAPATTAPTDPPTAPPMTAGVKSTLSNCRTRALASPATTPMMIPRVRVFTIDPF